MEIQLALMSTVFAFCYGREENNITFHANKTTWNKAVEYCANSGGVLYSDELYIRNRTDDELDNTGDIWTGKYEAFSPWAITWGCYRVNFGDYSKDVFTVSYADQQECQTICYGSEFYAIKGTICKCLHATEVDEHRKENTNPCTCSTCVIVRKYLENVDIRSYTGCLPTNRDCTCMAAACIENRLIHTPEICNRFYGVVCDNNKTTTAKDLEAALQFCDEQFSILRWYTQDQDICELGASQHWTSGRRSVNQYIVQFKDKVSNLKPLSCFKVKQGNDQGPDYVDCDHLLPFFCGNIDAENIISNDNDKSDNQAGVIIEIGVSITVVVLITVVISVFIFRRIHSTELLPTANSADFNKRDMHNNTAMSDYEELNYKDEDKSTKPYDRLNVTLNSDHINDELKTIVLKEELILSNTKAISGQASTLDYQHLDTSEKDKITNSYDPLHVAHTTDTYQVNGHSTTIIAREEQQNYESIENTNDIVTHTASSEYEQLDNAGKGYSTNTYDQLDVAHEEYKSPD